MMLHLNGKGQTPAEQYYVRKVLGKSEGIEEIGGLKWDLCFCLLACWLLIFFSLIKGIKVVYFTATFHFIILIILLMRVVTLDGAIDGVIFYVKPDLKHLWSAKVWGAAAGQVFFSLSLATGGLTTLAGYNDFHNRLFRDALIVVVANSAPSIFAGFVIFPIIGFIAKETGKTVIETAEQGTGLAFVVYAEAATRLEVPQFWAIIFFFMLMLLAVDTMIVLVQVVVNAIIYQLPSFAIWKKKVVVIALVCTAFFLCGLSMCTPGGSYILKIFEKYTGGWALIVACLCEVCMVSYVYGIKRFTLDIRCMLGVPKHAFYKRFRYPVNPYWTVCWLFLAPALLALTLVFNLIDFGGGRTRDGQYLYPIEVDIVGWILALCILSWIPVIAIREIILCKRRGDKMLLSNLTVIVFCMLFVAVTHADSIKDSAGLAEKKAFGLRFPYENEQPLPVKGAKQKYYMRYIQAYFEALYDKKLKLGGLNLA